MRRPRAAAGAPRYGVDVVEHGGRREKRWPDLVLEQPDRRVAIEFERTAKAVTVSSALPPAIARRHLVR